MPMISLTDPPIGDGPLFTLRPLRRDSLFARFRRSSQELFWRMTTRTAATITDGGGRLTFTLSRPSLFPLRAKNSTRLGCATPMQRIDSTQRRNLNQAREGQ